MKKQIDKWRRTTGRNRTSTPSRGRRVRTHSAGDPPSMISDMEPKTVAGKPKKVDKRMRVDAVASSSKARKRAVTKSSTAKTNATKVTPKKGIDPSTKVKHKPEAKAKDAKNAFFALYPKPEQIVRLTNGRKLEFWGLRDATGERYILTREGRQVAITRYKDWHAGGGDGSNALRDQGIPVPGAMGEVRAVVAALKKSPEVPVVIAPGWSPHGFAQANGQTLVAEGAPVPLRTFLPYHDMLGSQGSLAGWLEDMAELLAGHHFATFFIMMMFTGPLLRLTDRMDNFGFEVSGEAGRGKSTLLMLMASAAGPAVGVDGSTYWRSLNTTMNALETVLPQYDDMPLLLDEAGLMPSAGKSHGRALGMRDMAFRLSQGRVRHRHGETAGNIHRTVFAMSTNVPLATLLGTAHAAEADAVADRLMTVPLLPERRYGIFDRCPKGYESTGAFAEALKRAAGEHFGVAMPAFLQYLVEERATRPEWLRSKIAGKVSRFIRECGADANDGSQRRVAEAFGLVYAAGVFAKRAGVLPASYRCMTAAQTCYALHRNHGRLAISFDDRLRTLMRHPAAIDLDEAGVQTLSQDECASCPVFLYTGRSGSRELLVPTRHRAKMFGDWNVIRHTLEFQHRHLRARDNVVPRPVGFRGKMIAVYAFNIDDLTA